MNSVVTQENLKAIGVLVTAFLASISVASFLYIQPGSAEAAADNTPCSSTAVVEDVEGKEATVAITINTTSGCSPEHLIVSTMSPEGYETTIQQVGAEKLNRAEGFRYSLILKIYDYVDYYTVKIPGAFSGSIMP